MATTAGFKQQCPSCEAMVAIKDPKFIGRKIDCPKCKYRFVVEEPADEKDDNTPPPTSKKGKAVADQKITAKKPTNGKAAVANGKSAVKHRAEDEEDQADKPAPKKKSGGASTTMILGVGLAGVAVILLVVGILAIAGVFSSSKDKTGGLPPGQQGNNSGENEQKKEDPKKPVNLLVDVTNLLPNDTDTVFAVQVQKLRDSLLGDRIFKTPGSFHPAYFSYHLGFDTDDVVKLVRAENTAKAWSFNVVRTNKSVNRDQVIKTLKLQPAKTPKGADYFVVGGKNDVLDCLAQLVQVAKHGLPDESSKGPAPAAKPLAVTFYDKENQTLIFADKEPLEEFLDDARPLKQRYLSKVPNAPAEGEKQPKQPDGEKPPPVDPKPGEQPKPGEPPLKPGELPLPGKPSSSDEAPKPNPKDKPAPQFRDQRTEVPLPPSGPPASSGGGRPQPGGDQQPGGGQGQPHQPPPGDPEEQKPPPFTETYMTVKPALKAMLDQLQHDSKEDLLFSMASVAPGSVWVLQRAADAFGLPFSAHATGVRDLEVLGVAVPELSDAQAGCTVAVEFKSKDTAKNAATLLRTWLMPMVLASLKQKGLEVPDMEKKPAPGQVPPGQPQPPLIQPGQPQPPPPDPNKKPEDQPPSPITVNLQDKKVVLTLDAKLNKVLADDLKGLCERAVLYFKGTTDMVSRSSRIHELAAAVRAYVEEHGKLPRGTADRPLNQERFGLPWSADQRVSWMVELLPYLPQFAEYRAKKKEPLQVTKEESWRQAGNATPAFTLIPQFVDGSRPETTWWISYPHLKTLVAATHYVGIAGVGLDAAEYMPQDGMDKKMGAFGYDRETLAADIKDGADKTIALLMVPVEYKTPWLAGGGSTVRGVAETDSVRPFVCTQHDGKNGTLAVMCDGKVRFIAEDISDKDFQALCTIAGGEEVDIDKLAPEVPAPKVAVELKPAFPNVPPLDPQAPRPGNKPPEPKADAGKDGAWDEYVSKAEGFAVLMPGTPQQGKQKVQSPIGEFTVQVFNLELKEGVRYAVLSMVLPTAVKPDQTEEYLDGARAGFVNTLNGKAQNEKKIKLGDNPGREFEVDVPGQGVFKTRMYLVDQKHYQTVVGPLTKVAAKDADKFLDSFKLLKDGGDPKPPPKETGDASKGELKKLQGTWIATHYEEGGKPFPVDPNKPHQLTITGDKFTLVYYFGGAEEAANRGAGTLKLDPTKSPKAADLMFTGGAGQGTTAQAIYELVGDELTVCLAVPGDPRPSEFRTRGTQLLYKFQRKK